MTKAFDDKARAFLELTYHEPNLTRVELNELQIEEISAKAARGYIAAFHYSHTFPDSSRFIFGLYYKNILCGVCVFGMGCGKNQYTSVYSSIKNGEYIELTRLWVEDSLRKNTESWFISRCIKMLPNEIKIIVSFSDEKRNHIGYIYQATNFLYLGKNGGGKMLITEDGIEKHPRLLGIYRKRHPEYKNLNNEELMDLLGYKYTKGGAKHKYVFFKDKRLKKKIGIKSLPYPKEVKNGINK